MNPSQQAITIEKEFNASTELGAVALVIYDQMIVLSQATDKLMAGIDALRELRESLVLLIRQTQIEQSKQSILAELSRRDLDDELARIKKLERDYQVFREASGT